MHSYCLSCKECTDNITSKKWLWQIKGLEKNQDVLIVLLIN